MIEYKTGSLFDSDAVCWVNTVNCVGVMGKGIALEFKKRFPAMFIDYKRACTSGALRTGTVQPWRNNRGTLPEWIVNFPTKDDWRNPSQLSYIYTGLVDLARFIRSTKVRSVAIPALGCSNGGLKWDDVRLHIESFANRVDADIFVYPPGAEKVK